MALTEEKVDVQYASSMKPEDKDHSLNASKDQEKDVSGYMPASEEEYVVTVKTWIVVAVCESFLLSIPSITSLDPVLFLRDFLLDSPNPFINPRLRFRRAGWRAPSSLLHLRLHHDGDNCIHDMWCKL